MVAPAPRSPDTSDHTPGTGTWFTIVLLLLLLLRCQVNVSGIACASDCAADQRLHMLSNAPASMGELVTIDTQTDADQMTSARTESITGQYRDIARCEQSHGEIVGSQSQWFRIQKQEHALTRIDQTGRFQ